MSVATAAGADEASYAEKREGAGSGDHVVLEVAQGEADRRVDGAPLGPLHTEADRVDLGPVDDAVWIHVRHVEGENTTHDVGVRQNQLQTSAVEFRLRIKIHIERPSRGAASVGPDVDREAGRSGQVGEQVVVRVGERHLAKPICVGRRCASRSCPAEDEGGGAVTSHRCAGTFVHHAGVPLRKGRIGEAGVGPLKSDSITGIGYGDRGRVRRIRTIVGEAAVEVVNESRIRRTRHGHGRSNTNH